MTDDYQRKKRRAAEQITDHLNEDTGVVTSATDDVDVGTMAGADEDDWFRGFIDGAMLRLVELMLEQGRDTDEWALNYIDDIEKVYVTDRPWRCPLVVVEIADCPDWLACVGSTDIEVHDKPGLSQRPDTMRYQIRKS